MLLSIHLQLLNTRHLWSEFLSIAVLGYERVVHAPQIISLESYTFIYLVVHDRVTE